MMRKLATITAVAATLVFAGTTLPASDAAARVRIEASPGVVAVVSLKGLLQLSQRNRYRLRLRRPTFRRGPTIRRRSTTRSGRPTYGARSSGRILPLSVIAPRVLARVPGQLRGGRLIGRHYLIKILSRTGRLVYVYADARTGRIARIRR